MTSIEGYRIPWSIDFHRIPWCTILILTRKNCFRYLKLISHINAAICTTIYLERQKCYGLGKKILFKKQLFDLEVKGQGPTKVITYATHRLMVMHPHTKYHWPISNDKNVMAQTRKYYLKNNNMTLRSKSHEGHYGMRHTALWSCTHIPNKCYLKNNYLTLSQRSRSHEGHNRTRHTALWSCTHIPNIIDLSRKTKMLWFGQENTI
jgi:uncharacterized cupin superfamily protein